MRLDRLELAHQGSEIEIFHEENVPWMESGYRKIPVCSGLRKVVAMGFMKWISVYRLKSVNPLAGFSARSAFKRLTDSQLCDAVP